ncbi:MAG: VIT1/CCC1 transporter family protein [Simkaniaceae bacterium]|nr:VIT1/CCC1 transporter family protein [Candidatus Sacchlamyda saccharinae]
MTHQNPPEHFKGKSVSQHLKDARLRGARATSETHGTELPGHFSAGSDSAKNTSVLFLILFAASASFPLLIAFGVGWIIWSAGRSALLGWARLERLHRVIEEERFEIEHHRDQEKEELREMYADKGFSGKLLDEVVEVLMSDDNRLLKIMLEEELGLSLEAYEHPLKQATGAALGALVSFALALMSFYFWPKIGIPLTSFLVIAISANMTAKYEKRKALSSVIWNFSLALFAALVVYFLAKLL